MGEFNQIYILRALGYKDEQIAYSEVQNSMVKTRPNVVEDHFGAIFSA